MNQDTERSEIKTIRDHPIADTIGKRSYLPKTSSLLISLAILGLLILVSGFVQKREYIPGPTNLRQAFPRTIGEYKSTEDAPIDQEILDELELTDYLNRTYLSPKGYAVHLYVGYVNSQNEMPLIHTPVGCLPGGGNAILSHEAVPWWQAPAGRGQAGQQEPSQNINLIRLASGEEKQIVIYWYQERGRIIQNDWMERFYLFWDAVVRGRTDGALVRFITAVGPSENMEQAEQRIRDFVQKTIPFLQSELPGKDT
ncbi:MAG: EpsI family protein [Nitrospirae bacterium CG_4_10_14_3_um_filter_53_41]|nr:EpsI family protein [Deltaproteobacteria bacterium]OIP64756.1 MAG: EpsI family protein [Nitrospirae bacterium CG2_30_53_67]PIV85062.1 MAG: EpsI family protein [Nitrospirae bacterium CG17_big_fil_post_rev_8_21_14_2_50_50_9]PIX85711.1 MAG: EpsI family protein [Nitrospirae bacterium CG_4_10_14_3_um_filter_53_41]